MTDRPIDFVDVELQCKDCGDTFTWFAGEQEYYSEKGLQQPKRCRRCRERMKKAKAKVIGNDSRR